MKCKAVDRDTFKPLTIEITIESEAELVNLWHRLNISIYDILGSCGYTRKAFPGCKEADTSHVFLSLDAAVKSLDLTGKVQ